MNVKLIGHTQLSDEFIENLSDIGMNSVLKASDGQVIAMSAIRNCYSHNKPSEIVELEGQKYFGKVATDGKSGTEADRLIRHIMNSGHRSTVEHLNFSFAIEDVSRALLAQITRHRHFSFSVESQRYCKFGSKDKSEGIGYVIPQTVIDKGMEEYFVTAMSSIQTMYDELREAGVPAEDARAVLPNAATTNIVLTGNLRSILEFYSKRSSNHAQTEIRELAELIKEKVVEVEPWTEPFFN